MGNKTNATFLHRFLALMIDLTIVTLIQVLFSTYFDGGSGMHLLISMGYFTFSLVKYQGQTIGKRLLAIQVVKEDHTAVDFGTALIRWFGYYLSAILLGIGFLIALFSHRKQALHDKLAHTVVVNTGEKPKYLIVLGILVVPILIISMILVMLAVAITYVRDNAKTRAENMNINSKFVPTMTMLESSSLEKDIFQGINSKRAGFGLPAFVQQEQLCEYGLSRLEQIEKLGRYDDGRGHNESIPDLGAVGEIYRPIKLPLQTNKLINSFFIDKQSILLDPEKIFACVRISGTNALVITASPGFSSQPSN